MKPRIYIPTLYFIQGLPYTIVNSMSIVIFKNLQIQNDLVGLYTTILGIPWVIKALWAPLVDFKSTRRHWIVVAQLVLAAISAVLVGALIGGLAVPALLLVFILMGFTSATQDIAMDGYYLDVLNEKEKALYVGVRNAFYKVAFLVGSGLLVYFAGLMQEKGLGVRGGWSAVLGICAVIFLLAAIFHRAFLPHPEKRTGSTAVSLTEIKRVFCTFFQQPKIGVIVFYILTFRLGDAFMLKMAQPFLLDPLEKGGLAISTKDVGLIYGTVGMVALLAGGLVGGWVVSRFGLRKTLMPSAIIQNSAILLYWGLAAYKPSLTGVAVVNAYEQFSYGMGVAAYTVFLLTTVKEEYKAAHYAIATALMALGLMLPGALSGYLQGWLGYERFFLLSFIASLPGIISIFYLPLQELAPAQEQH